MTPQECPGCGFALAGLPCIGTTRSVRCPECGQVTSLIDRSHVDRPGDALLLGAMCAPLVLLVAIAWMCTTIEGGPISSEFVSVCGWLVLVAAFLLPAVIAWAWNRNRRPRRLGLSPWVLMVSALGANFGVIAFVGAPLWAHARSQIPITVGVIPPEPSPPPRAPPPRPPWLPPRGGVH